MSFSSLTFLVFLGVVYILYWRVRSYKSQNLLLAITSFLFYGWWNYQLCLLLFLTSCIDYLTGRWLFRLQHGRQRRLLLILDLGLDFSLLGYFKYHNFFIDNLRSVVGLGGWEFDTVTLYIILPLGISFYTFQSIAYTVDIYRREIQPAASLVEYLAFLSFFPQLVAGPIVRAAQMLPQFSTARTLDLPKAVDGCHQILWGLFKKMVLADNLASIVNTAYAEPSAAGGIQLLIATICFAFQIYFDFSGYSDIAIGTSRLFGFELMRNFAYPYFAQTLTQFWRCWHISLSTWFRDYVYIPLGGARGSTARVACNLMVTFLFSGLWHGSSWNFLIWGAIHGTLMSFEKLVSRRRKNNNEVPAYRNQVIRSVRSGYRIARTFSIVCVAWVFFRAATFNDSMNILKAISTDLMTTSLTNYMEILRAIDCSVDKKLLLFLVAATIGIEWVKRRCEHPLKIETWPGSLRFAACMAILWGTICWGTAGNQQFIYFNF